MARNKMDKRERNQYYGSSTNNMYSYPSTSTYNSYNAKAQAEQNRIRKERREKLQEDQLIEKFNNQKSPIELDIDLTSIL